MGGPRLGGGDPGLGDVSRHIELARIDTAENGRCSGSRSAGGFDGAYFHTQKHNLDDTTQWTGHVVALQ
jgi:hypothetical protein